MTLAADTAAILVDIEGTTTPISFVYDVLFPFAAARLEETCVRAADDPEIAAAVEQLREEHHAEESNGGAPPAFGNGATYAHYLMELDRKSTGLKVLQGRIWLAGYSSGQLRGEVFDDVPPALRRWRALGLRLRVFSSGSVLAQQLLFSSTEHGDLTEHFEGFHDTTTGPKRAPESYAAIAGAFDLPPGSILFLSDTPAELEAAATAGLHTGLLARPGNPTEPESRHRTLRSFAELSA